MLGCRQQAPTWCRVFQPETRSEITKEPRGGGGTGGEPEDEEEPEADRREERLAREEAVEEDEVLVVEEEAGGPEGRERGAEVPTSPEDAGSTGPGARTASAGSSKPVSPVGASASGIGWKLIWARGEGTAGRKDNDTGDTGRSLGGGGRAHSISSLSRSAALIP